MPTELRSRGLPVLAAEDLAAAKAMLSDPEITTEEVARRLHIAPFTLYRYTPGDRKRSERPNHADARRLPRSLDPESNIYRVYSITYEQDLFGKWVMETTYGRIGQRASDRPGRQ